MYDNNSITEIAQYCWFSLFSAQWKKTAHSFSECDFSVYVLLGYWYILLCVLFIKMAAEREGESVFSKSGERLALPHSRQPEKCERAIEIERERASLFSVHINVAWVQRYEVNDERTERTEEEEAQKNTCANQMLSLALYVLRLCQYTPRSRLAIEEKITQKAQTHIYEYLWKAKERERQGKRRRSSSEK